MSGGLLTQFCDPFGIERERYGERLAGGLYGPEHVGKYVWHCTEKVIGRYKFVCKGGEYGFRRQNDGGLIRAYHCDGGHSGEPMNLCQLHVREMADGPPPPGWSADKKNSYGQIGGTVSNEMCPRCVAPPEARELSVVADALQQEIAQLHIAQSMTGIIGLNIRRIAKLTAAQDQVRARLDELFASGRVHKCPLKLVEVS